MIVDNLMGIIWVKQCGSNSYSNLSAFLAFRYLVTTTAGLCQQAAYYSANCLLGYTQHSDTGLLRNLGIYIYNDYI